MESVSVHFLANGLMMLVRLAEFLTRDTRLNMNEYRPLTQDGDHPLSQEYGVLMPFLLVVGDGSCSDNWFVACLLTLVDMMKKVVVSVVTSAKKLVY